MLDAELVAKHWLKQLNGQNLLDAAAMDVTCGTHPIVWNHTTSIVILEVGHKKK